MTRGLFLSVLGLLTATALQAADNHSREQLQQEQQAIEAEFERRAQACRDQFVVTPCLDKVRADKHEALRAVSAQIESLDAAERQRRADARAQRLAEKKGASDRASAVDGSTKVKAPRAPRAEPTPRAPREPKKTVDPAERRAREAESRAAFEARQREIRAHRESVEKRNAERALKKPAPRPLPIPPASSAS